MLRYCHMPQDIIMLPMLVLSLVLIVVLSSNQPKVLKGIYDSVFFFFRTHRYLALARADIIVLTFFNTDLIFNLPDVKVSHIEAIFLFNPFLDVPICRLLIWLEFALFQGNAIQINLYRDHLIVVCILPNE